MCSSEFNNSFLDSLGSDEDSGNEDVLDMEYTEAEAEELKRNAEVGDSDSPIPGSVGLSVSIAPAFHLHGPHRGAFLPFR